MSASFVSCRQRMVHEFSKTNYLTICLLADAFIPLTFRLTNLQENIVIPELTNLHALDFLLKPCIHYKA